MAEKGGTGCGVPLLLRVVRDPGGPVLLGGCKGPGPGGAALGPREVPLESGTDGCGGP